MICNNIISSILNWIELIICIWIIGLIYPTLEIFTHHSWMIEMTNDIVDNIELTIITNPKNSEQP